MPQENRAAQFAPYATLRGYDDLVREAARETEQQILTDETEKAELNAKLMRLLQTDPPPEATFTVFVPDAKKAGGAYETVAGRVARFDESCGLFTLDSGQIVKPEYVVAIESEAFNRG